MLSCAPSHQWELSLPFLHGYSSLPCFFEIIAILYCPLVNVNRGRLWRPGWRGFSSSFYCPPRLRGGKGTGVVRSRQATENPVTRFPLGKGGAVRHQRGAAHRARRLCKRVEEKGSKGSKGCGGALRAHYIMAPPAPTLPPRSGLYNSPLNQPGRRSRFRAEPKAAQGRSPGGGLNPLNPLAFGNTAF